MVGITNDDAKRMGYELELEAAVNSMKAMLKRGIRVLPGGDYGFAWAPHGENAKDLEYFVKYLNMTPMEAIISATRWGGQIMMKKDLGEIREGWLADLLLVDGDPLANISILQDKSQAARHHEGRRVRQGARDPLQPEPLRRMKRVLERVLGGSSSACPSSPSRSGGSRTTRACSSSHCSTA